MQLNTNFISLPKKVVLETYEKPEEGQFYHKGTFAIPMDIPGGKGNSYHVVLNEVLFKNTAPLLEDGDYFSVTFSGDQASKSFQVNIKHNYYWSTIPDFVNTLISFLQSDGDGVYNNILKINLLGDVASPAGSGVIFQSTVPFTLEYSNNFGYIFNNLNKTIPSVAATDVRSYSAEDIEYVSTLITDADPFNNVIVFPYLRLSGPFNFYVRTNLIAQVPTYNEVGQTFNMSLGTYNTTYSLGDFVQLASTMINLGQNITNLTIELVNDFLEPVHIKSPMHVQITVTPDLRPADNMQYYQ